MKRNLLACAVMLAMNLAVSAQSGDAAGGPPPPPPHGMPGFMPGGPMGMGMHPGKTVAGAPYSADINDSMVQTLADGNSITRSTTGHVARDRQGRTYMEQDVSGGPWAQGPKKMTFLMDPVAGYAYVLNADEKVAIRRPLKSNAGEPTGPRGEEGRDRPDSQNHVVADLGQQTISGVVATGKSITRTVPAGSIGNAQPIVSKNEVWTSNDLQIVVLSKHSDPRMGQATHSLTNIQRTDPPAALFQVPADYAVKDAPAGGHHGGMQR